MGGVYPGCHLAGLNLDGLPVRRRVKTTILILQLTQSSLRCYAAILNFSAGEFTTEYPNTKQPEGTLNSFILMLIIFILNSI